MRERKQSHAMTHHMKVLRYLFIEEYRQKLQAELDAEKALPWYKKLARRIRRTFKK